MASVMNLPLLYIVCVDSAQSQGATYYRNDCASVRAVCHAVLCRRGNATFTAIPRSHLLQHGQIQNYKTALSADALQQS